ncbi:MAPEG family protein [Hyphococcus sp.]|uniref:MAPEG family protein n=1 Tax=Hyphococcus sp. TaxID=2038636 RepID=UPI002085605A|nr:MAG: membrane protein [Marinicaulis sp.]
MTTPQLILFAAVFAQVALTLVVYLLLVRARFAYASDRANLKPELAYDQSAWPVSSRQIANSVTSQFELPVLFYAGVLFAFQFGAAGWLAAALAWIFVATRIAHAFIHIGKNIMMTRFQFFLAGFVMIAVFWINLAITVLTRGAV